MVDKIFGAVLLLTILSLFAGSMVLTKGQVFVSAMTAGAVAAFVFGVVIAIYLCMK